MIQRFVHFEFTDEFTPDDAETFEGIVSRWPDAMPWLLRVRCGRPYSTKPVRSRPGYVLDLEFADLEGFERYTEHPEHLRLREFLSRHPYDVLIFDLDVQPPWR